MVKVRHPNGYVTCYLHLSAFATGIGRGSPGHARARWLGSSAKRPRTAPHLDYRVQHQGHWIDPMSLKGVPAAPLPKREMAAFRGWRERCARRCAAA